MFRLALALLGGAAAVAVYRSRQATRVAPGDRCRCPACGAAIMVTRFHRARQAFACARCGETGTWL